MSKFKTGDKVRKNSDRSRIGTVQHCLGDGWYSVEFKSGKVRHYHQNSLIQVNKQKPLPPKQDRTELYKLLPSTTQWMDRNWCAIDGNGAVYTYMNKPSKNVTDNIWSAISDQGCTVPYIGSTPTLPPSISWRDTLVSREELEAWELLQKFEAAKPEPKAVMVKSSEFFSEDQFVKEQSTQPETPQAKVERLKAELKQAEDELKKLEPLEVLKYESVFQNNISSPPNLQNKCLMFKTEYTRMEQHQWQFSGVDYTVLTFFRK